MQWALDRNDPEQWLEAGGDQTAALIAENDGPFKHHLDRYKYAKRYEGAEEKAHRTEGMKFLQKLDTQLNRTENLFGEKRSFADIAIFPFIRQFRIADMAWFDAQGFSNLQGWLARHMESDLFASVMMKYDVWSPGDDITVFS